MIPCIEDKCITWPICRNSEVITCPILNKYCYSIDKYSTGSGHIFLILHEYFPRLHTIFGDEKKIAHVDGLKALKSALSRVRKLK